jgi:hypothetical protein
MSEFILPKAPTKSKLINPSPFLIFGVPKIGKTTSIAALENCLVINLEDPVQTADGMVVYAPTLEVFRSILKAIIKDGKPYNYLAIDTLTKLEEFCIVRAEEIYVNSPMGAGWIKRDDKGKLLPTCGKSKYKSILFLPNGSGYMYLRQAFDEITTLIKKCAPNIIYIAHVKQTNILKDGVEFTSSDINLVGKNKQNISAEAQAIAFMRRVGGKNYLCFQPSEDVLAGCKIKRLEGKEILISEYDEDDNLITHWDQIYIKE